MVGRMPCRSIAIDVTAPPIPPPTIPTSGSVSFIGRYAFTVEEGPGIAKNLPTEGTARSGLDLTSPGDL